jgi:hypothetical protein
MRSTGRRVSAILIGLVCCGTCYRATAQEAPKRQLQILVIGGEGSINNVKQRTAREPVVEVRDENNRPVAGAIVFFKVPDYGASGTFTNGAKFTTVTTDEQGQAVARNFQPNQTQGEMQMQVTASLNGVTASTVIHMRNAAGPASQVAKTSSGSGKIIAIVAAIGAAAAVGIVVGTRGGSSNPSTPPSPATTITAGNGTVGGRP